MTRACRPLPAGLPWLLLACAAVTADATPAAAQSCASPDLPTLVSFPLTGSPQAVVEGDFDRSDNTGSLDVVVARDGANEVTLLRGDGAGAFTFVADYAVGTDPRDIVAADFNRDGKLDLAVANEGSATISVLEGTGAGFVVKPTLAAGGAPVRLAVADFDRDGQPDLVVVHASPAGIRVLLARDEFAFTVGSDRSVTGATAAVTGDFDEDGTPDLAVAQGSLDRVAIYIGRGDGYLGNGGPSWTTLPLVTVTVGVEPVDLAAADVDDDGHLDLVTVDRAGGVATASALTVLRGAGTGQFPNRETVNPAGLGDPVRVALADVDRDGLLDLSVLDASVPPEVMVLRGTGDWRPAVPPPTPRTFDDTTPFSKSLTTTATPRDLDVADIAANGRIDLIVAEDGPTDGLVTVLPNESGPNCPRTSLGDAPRAYPAGNGPWAAAVADMDEDGLEDLVIAQANATALALLKGTGGGYAAPGDPVGSPLVARARGVATADFDFDGHADVAAALGNTGGGRLRVFLGTGTGTLNPGVILADGLNVSGVVVGDFDGDGGPDLAATSQGTGELYVFLGEGNGSFTSAPESPITVGGMPWALAAGDIDGDGELDLAVANYSSNTVSILTGDGDGTFTPRPAVAVGAAPWSVALGRVDADASLDLVTANQSSTNVSLAFGDGTGAFGGLETLSGFAPGVPITVAVLDATRDAIPDVLVATSQHTLRLLEGPYVRRPTATFASEETIAVRQRPSQMVPVDVDADGTPDLVVPCKDTNDVVVLLARPSGPPVYRAAATVSVGDAPAGAAAGDLDGDGDADLVVVNSGDNSISILANDGDGVFTPTPSSPVVVCTTPVAVVAVDLDLDSIPDLALSCPGEGKIVFRKGNGAVDNPGFGTPATPSLLLAQADDLVAGDFDRDGDPDLAVLSKSGNTVSLILNDRDFALRAAPSPSPYTVGTAPTALFSGDFNANGTLDLAVANDNSDNLHVLLGDGGGGFTVLAPLGLGGHSSPLSVTGGDYDGDGHMDLATVAFGGHKLILFKNNRALAPSAPFPTTPSATLDAPREPGFVTSTDLNRDGTLDLALAASGLKAMRGKAGLDFETGDDVLAGVAPAAVVPGDFNRDGLPDLAVVNTGSDDVSIVLSTACMRRRLVVSSSPASCTAGPSPFGVSASVEVQDDGGNRLACETGTMAARIAPGTGAGGSLGGTTSVPVTSGVARFSALSIDPGGERYRLRFDLPGAPSALSRSFSLDATAMIVGSSSVCPGTSETYAVAGNLDTFVWTLSPSGPGFPTFTPSAVLTHAALTPETPYTLGFQGRVDGCAPPASLNVYVGNLFRVTIASSGPVSACVDCLGGTFTVTDTGGGIPTARQWGYRTVPGTGAVTAILGETGDTYVFKGTDFPGPGTYALVETTTPAAGCGTPVVSNEIAVTVTASVPAGETQSLGVLSRGSNLSGENVLRWVNSGPLQEVLVRWNKAPDTESSCLSPVDPVSLPVTGEDVITYSGTPPAQGLYAHSGLEPHTIYCYSVFARTASYAPGRIVKARPFDTAGSVKWAYATGATAVVPPVVAGAGVMAMSNDRTVHSLERGSNGGAWPTRWMPATLTGVAHSRSPVIPLGAPVGGADALLLVGDDMGDVHAINASTGGVVWGPRTPAPGSKITGAPGGMFVQYGGIADVVLVGTRDDGADSGALHTLNLGTGTVISSFSGGGAMGPVTATPVIDYASARVYVASFSKSGSGPSLWCAQIGASGSLSACAGFTAPHLGHVATSPVLRRGRLYVSNSTDVYSVDATTGSAGPPFSTRTDGAVKGFLFPDRRNDDLHFATNSSVWSVTDAAGSLSENWRWDAGGTLLPSPVLHWPDTNLLYVGSQRGTLYELDFTLGGPPAVKSVVLGDGSDHIGAPSLDVGVDVPDVPEGKKLLLVGSESGVLYAVEVPLP